MFRKLRERMATPSLSESSACSCGSDSSLRKSDDRLLSSLWLSLSLSLSHSLSPPLSAVRSLLLAVLRSGGGVDQLPLGLGMESAGVYTARTRYYESEFDTNESEIQTDTTDSRDWPREACEEVRYYQKKKKQTN